MTPKLTGAGPTPGAGRHADEPKLRERDFDFGRPDDLRDRAMRGLESAVVGDIPGWVGLVGGKRARKYDLPKLRSELDDALADSDGLNLVGYSAVFDQWTEIYDWWDGEYEERLAKGCFAKTLADRGDRVVVQYDHGRHPMIGSLPIAATRAVWEDDHGLFGWDRLHESELFAPVREVISSGAVKGQSFRFELVSKTDEEDGKGNLLRRTITEVVLHERGPVVFPAYEGTDVAVRSWVAALPGDLRELLVAAVVARDSMTAGMVTPSTPTGSAARAGHADGTGAADQTGPSASDTRTELRQLADVLRETPRDHPSGAAPAAA